MSVSLLSATNIKSSGSQNFVNGNSRVLILCFQSAINGTDAPTFNGVAFTLYEVISTAGSNVNLWYMYLPTDGSHTFTPNGLNNCNVYVFVGVDSTLFDVIVNDLADVVNTGVTITPNLSGGMLIFFQQARSGSGPQVQTAGQGNVLGMQFGAAMTHASPGAGVAYSSTVTYSPTFGPYDQLGIALAPFVTSPSASRSPSSSTSLSPSASTSPSASSSPSRSPSSSMSPSSSPSPSPGPKTDNFMFSD